MPQICGYAGKIIPEIIDALNGSGPKPEAVTLGGTSFFFGKAGSVRMKRHEYQHVLQSAARCPSWARWLPVRVRAWLGAPKFLPEYIKQHELHGYSNNSYEIEARKAEDGL